MLTATETTPMLLCGPTCKSPTPFGNSRQAGEDSWWYADSCLDVLFVQLCIVTFFSHTKYINTVYLCLHRSILILFIHFVKEQQSCYPSFPVWQFHPQPVVEYRTQEGWVWASLLRPNLSWARETHLSSLGYWQFALRQKYVCCAMYMYLQRIYIMIK